MSNQDLPPANNPGNITPVAGINEDPATAEKHRLATDYMRDALKAFEMGDLNAASRYANLARDLPVNFRASEPNPDQMLAEIYRRENAARVAAGGKPGDVKGNAPPAVKPQDARAMVRQARALVKKGEYEEAERLIALASETRPHGWGLFEDSPDKLQRDLIKLRGKRDRDKALLIMKDARKLFNEGKIKEAKELAFEAKALHGPYSIWEMDERPQHLIDEIYRLEMKDSKQHVAKKQDVKDDTKSDDPPSGLIPAAQAAAKRNQALALLREAGTLQAKGTRASLVEARNKLIEANNLNVAFEPNEPSPASMMADLAALCRNTLNQDLQTSVSMVNAVADPERFQKARQLLNEAREFCMIFGQDPQPIDQQIALVMQNQGQAPPPPRPYTAVQKEGLARLNQARIEMENGRLDIARRLAEEAFDKKYDIQQEAGYMLRTLDAADRQRAIEEVNVNARSGIDAFNHKEYLKAAQILKNLDMRYLYPQVLSQVREILSTREMQPGNLVQAAPDLPPPGGGGFAADRPKDQKGQPGKASAGDTAPERDLNAIRAIEKVQFGYWRDRSIGIQQKAIEICKTDPGLAIACLQDFLEELRATSFNQNDQDALIRPIEIRINQYKTIRAQQVWEKQQAGSQGAAGLYELLAKEGTEDAHGGQASDRGGSGQARSREAGILMEKGKYEEALREYEICHQLLPKRHGSHRGRGGQGPS